MPTSKGFTTHQSVHGFTLIELLVVISIIAILSIVGLVAYTGFMKNSRDGRRQADLKFIQSALEQYHADQIKYPDSIAFGNALVFGGKTYLTKVPNDPIGDPDYDYKPSGISYCLYARLEGTNRPASDSGCTPASPYNYGVTRP